MIQQNQLHPSLPTGLATGVHTGIHAGIHAGLHIGLHTGIHTGIHTGLRPVACAQVDVSRVRISMHQPMAEWQLTHQHVGHKRRRRARVGACPPQLIVPCIDTQQPLDPLSGQQATGAKQHTRDEHVRTPVATAAAPAATIPAATSALADSAIAARAPSSERGPGGIRVGGLCQKVQLGSDVRLQVSHHPPNVEAAGLQHGGHHPEDLEVGRELFGQPRELELERHHRPVGHLRPVDLGQARGRHRRRLDPRKDGRSAALRLAHPALGLKLLLDERGQ
mmetsp:Transcript_8853/g.29248  ORF Transcript_8853/g.29248 Transcript_8853/m.29248 type:complete len:278 (+) Transcript_8853:1085-1918(+)